MKRKEKNKIIVNSKTKEELIAIIKTQEEKVIDLKHDLEFHKNEIERLRSVGWFRKNDVAGWLPSIPRPFLRDGPKRVNRRLQSASCPGVPLPR